MKKMALSALIKQQGVEFTDFYLSEVEIEDNLVTEIIDTYVIDMVVLAYVRLLGTRVAFHAVQLVSEIKANIALENGATEAEEEVMELRPPAATTATLLSDGTIWFKDFEEGQEDVYYYCIHSPDHLLLPGHTAPSLA